MSSEKSITSFVSRLYTTIQRVGIKKVLMKLNELNMPEFSNYEKEVKQFIICKTLEVYNVKLEDINKKHVRGLPIIARSMCFIQLKKHLNLSHKQIALMFGRQTHSLVSNAIKDFNERKITLKQDKDFIDKFKFIDTQIKEFKDLILLKQESVTTKI